MTREQSKHLKSSVHRVTLQGALDVFLLDCQARRLASGTEAFYRQKLGNFLRFLEAQDVVEVENITPTYVRVFLVHLQERGHNPGGQRAHFRSVKTWLRFLEEEELLTKSPMHRVKMPRVPRRILPAFTPENVDQLLSQCIYVRDEAMICQRQLDVRLV